jgi:hypothetical protein
MVIGGLDGDLGTEHPGPDNGDILNLHLFLLLIENVLSKSNHRGHGEKIYLQGVKRTAIPSPSVPSNIFSPLPQIDLRKKDQLPHSFPNFLHAPCCSLIALMGRSS